MDERGIRILQAISELGSRSPDVIAEHTDIPKSTVHYRINNFEQQGIITDDLFKLDLKRLGIEITIITEVLAEYDEEYHEKVGEKLAEIEGVNNVYFTMGETDFVVIANLANRDMVSGLISEYERIDEIVRTNSQFVVEDIKNEPYPLNNFDSETLLDVLGEV